MKVLLLLGCCCGPVCCGQNQSDLHDHRVFPVLSINYDYVQMPFEVSLWILLASLLKLGENHNHIDINLQLMMIITLRVLLEKVCV